MTEETTFSYRISARFTDRSLIDFLAERFKYRPPAEWVRLIGLGKVTVNGETIEADRLLKKDDIVSYCDVLREPPVDRNIEVLHEEETFLVAHKPGNLPSHSVGRYIRSTFIFLLRKRMADSGFQGTLHLAHRLDRETSGVIVVAKTASAHRSLLRQFETGAVKKEYIAVVRGVINHDSFEVKGFLVPDQDSCISIRKKVVLDDMAGSKYSETAFAVVKRLASSTVRWWVTSYMEEQTMNFLPSQGMSGPETTILFPGWKVRGTFFMPHGLSYIIRYPASRLPSMRPCRKI
jgi:23S rRNA-/tRNA-specific pseudouridylate synthase